MKIAAVRGGKLEQRPQQLTRTRVLRAALKLADREGIESVSMRKLAQELHVEPMSLYTHVRNKDDLLVGMVDAVVGEIPVEPNGADWRTSLRKLMLAARAVMLRHPWAPAVIEAKGTPGPAVTRYFDVVIGTLRKGGFSVEQTHHALHVLGSRLLGFTQDPFDDSDELTPEAAAALVKEIGDTLPWVAEMAVSVTHEGALGGCDDDREFDFSLEFILDGLERLQAQEAARSRRVSRGKRRT